MRQARGWAVLAIAAITVLVSGPNVRPVEAAPAQVAPFAEIAFTHPSWGPSTLFVASDGQSCFFSVLDASGTEKWSAQGSDCPVDGWAYTPRPDAAGNMLIGYQGIRRAGVTALRPVADGMEEFSSLPYLDGDTTGSRARFADATAYDVNGDGTLEIVSILRPCDPDCATGDAYFYTFTWSGADYFAELCTLANWPQVPVQSSPGAGGTILGNIPADTCGVLTTGGVEVVGDEVWIAVSSGDLLGWAPDAAFALPPSEPPWPDNYDPWTQSAIPPPTSPPAAAAPAQCDNYTFNDQYPIRRCDEGYAVHMVQFYLSNIGYYVDSDGYFGPGTETVVRSFQAANGLDVDGLVGLQTWVTLTGGNLPGHDLDGNGVIDPDEVVWD